jgi:agarase
LPNKETLRQLTQADTALRGPGYRRDQERFAREFARRYFAVTAAAVRRHDPHHLILGCRFGAEPGAAIRAECGPPQVDVVSLGCDDETLPERIAAGHRPHAMPVLVGEFGWTGAAFKREASTGELAGRTTVERMLARGRATAERALAHPALVGYAWPRWVDRNDQWAPFGEGLVHIDDREAAEHTELFSDLNRRAPALRLAAANPAKP